MGMFDMMARHFAMSDINREHYRKHYTTNECCTVYDKHHRNDSNDSNDMNAKMLSIHHLCTPKSPKHCLATVVLSRRASSSSKGEAGQEEYTHVAMLDLGAGDTPGKEKNMRKHHRFLSSFHMLSKYCLSAGGGNTDVNPLHIPVEDIKSISMDTYDSVCLSDSLSFFWAPMTVVVSSPTTTTTTTTYDVGMSVQSLRHLPDDTTVILGQELRLAKDTSADAWVGCMLAECAQSGKFVNT